MTFGARLVDGLLEATVVGSFTKIGIEVRRRLEHWEDLDQVSMAGKVVLITGASSGLGMAAARRLARMGASVRIVGRDPAKTVAARDAIASESGHDDVGVYVADLSSLDDVRSLVAEVLDREDRLDVLVNNAGALLAERRESVDGHEMSFATMVLGPFALTEGLLPLLERTGGARVVNVSSGGMYTQRLVVDDLESRTGYRGSVAYARAKRALVVLTGEWGQRHAGSGVVFHAMHPGLAATPGVHASLPTFERVLGPLLRSPDQGADTIVWLAAAEEPTRSNGKFWHDRRPRGTHRLPTTREQPGERRRLWDLLVEQAGPSRRAGVDEPRPSAG
ncbi:MAG: SDR family NAD(P)-dependent oxidoreductase [Acidimicrobiia bacterium]|nr:SDR family NAD(P)-dependent oxidoreductase [Acidimicrobiia bacterium]